MVVTLVGAASLRADSGVPSYTPARVSLLEGEVSLWRPSYGDWQQASVNLALAAGDVLAAGARSRAEVQLGPRSFLRLGANSELRLDEQSDDVVRVSLTAGRIALDLRDARATRRIEVTAPSVTAEVRSGGFYRLEIEGGGTRLITRQGGRMWVVAEGQSRELGPNSQLVVDTAGSIGLASFAPPLDDWDRWNLERTERLLAARRAPVWSDEIYGLGELDAYGEWRRVPTYGFVWIPRVPRGWVPYSTGRWIWDPFYGWTWVDFAPWGWAPFHYGRWVFVSSVWAWTPGPVIVQPVYAPALVVFFSGSGFRVGLGVGVPVVSWVPLGWGEPCYPWWGPAWFVGKPWWGGWHGPQRGGPWFHPPHEHDRARGREWVDAFEHARFRRGVLGLPRERFGDPAAHGAERLHEVRLERPLFREEVPRRPQPPLILRGRGDHEDAASRRGFGLERRAPDGGRFGVHSDLTRADTPRRFEDGARFGGGQERKDEPRRPAADRGPAPLVPRPRENVEQTSPEERAASRRRDLGGQPWGPYAPRFRGADSDGSVRLREASEPRFRQLGPRRPDAPPPRDAFVSPPPAAPPPGEGRALVPEPPVQSPQGWARRDDQGRGALDRGRPLGPRFRAVEGFGPPRRETTSLPTRPEGFANGWAGGGNSDGEPRRERGFGSPAAPRRPTHR